MGDPMSVRGRENVCPSPNSHPPKNKVISRSRTLEYDPQIQPGILHWRPDSLAAPTYRTGRGEVLRGSLEPSYSVSGSGSVARQAAGASFNNDR